MGKFAAWAAPILAGACLAPTAFAGDGKLPLTGGVSTIDGAAGGGMVPWATTGTYASERQWGASASASTLSTPGYGFRSQSLAAVFGDRLEVSYGEQRLDTRQSLARLGLPGLVLRQGIAGAKLRLAGDILDQDSWMPQISVGAMRHKLDAGAFAPVLFGPLGARRTGNEFYVSATKLALSESILLSAAVRVTRANQDGLLGFGSAADKSWHARPEISAAWLAASSLALGAEVKFKNSNLANSALGSGALAEDRWVDAYVAWAPSKRFSLTGAWVDLGRIAPGARPGRQEGLYVSAQVSY